MHACVCALYIFTASGPEGAKLPRAIAVKTHIQHTLMCDNYILHIMYYTFKYMCYVYVDKHDIVYTPINTYGHTCTCTHTYICTIVILLVLYNFTRYYTVSERLILHSIIF